MKKNLLIKIICFNVLMLSCFNVFILPVRADALNDAIDKLGEFNQGAQLPANEDLAQTIVNIINIVLGFLALVFVILIIYGGFTYMTAGGTAEKTKTAIAILKNSVIGVIIILLSGIFVNYILETILERII